MRDCDSFQSEFLPDRSGNAEQRVDAERNVGGVRKAVDSLSVKRPSGGSYICRDVTKGSGIGCVSERERGSLPAKNTSAPASGERIKSRVWVISSFRGVRDTWMFRAGSERTAGSVGRAAGRADGGEGPPGTVG